MTRQATTVVVEKLSSEGVVAIYSWGPLWGTKPGWERVRGTIDGKKILLKLGVPPNTTTIALSTRDGKTAFAEYVGKDRNRIGWLDKKQ